MQEVPEVWRVPAAAGRAGRGSKDGSRPTQAAAEEHPRQQLLLHRVPVPAAEVVGHRPHLVLPRLAPSLVAAAVARLPMPLLLRDHRRMLPSRSPKRRVSVPTVRTVMQATCDASCFLTSLQTSLVLLPTSLVLLPCNATHKALTSALHRSINGALVAVYTKTSPTQFA